MKRRRFIDRTSGIAKLFCSDVTRHLFFFFQAEDGIRALYVTGVQTCALPISVWRRRAVRAAAQRGADLGLPARVAGDRGLHLVEPRHALPAVAKRQRREIVTGVDARSEERRVGKECTSRQLQASLIKRSTNCA